MSNPTLTLAPFKTPDIQGLNIKAMPGCVVIAECQRDSSGVVMVVDNNPISVGVVVSAGPRYVGEWLGKRVVSDPTRLMPGDAVLYRPDRGMAVSGFGWFDTADFDGDLRFFGTNGGPGSRVAFGRYSIDEAIMAVIGKNEALAAVGRNVVVQIDSVREQTDGGIHLIRSILNRGVVSRVTSVGPDCERDVRVGDRVVICPNSLHEILGVEPETGVCHEDAILAVMD